jgi:hypothetical protein
VRTRDVMVTGPVEWESVHEFNDACWRKEKADLECQLSDSTREEQILVLAGLQTSPI